MSNLLDQAETLQNLLVSRATGGEESEEDYVRLRRSILAETKLDAAIPRFLKTCRSLAQFWQFIKFDHGGYADRRKFLWEQFRPLLDAIERVGDLPSDPIISLGIGAIDAKHVHEAWAKALERRIDDPEGAITMARTLLESVCKHILESSGENYDENPEINRLYKLTSERLNIAPSQHTEQVFRQILGGCTAVVEGLGALRNRLGDSHGKGRASVKPAARHAELAVNLAGALSVFLLSTWDARGDTDKSAVTE